MLFKHTYILFKYFGGPLYHTYKNKIPYKK